MRNAVLFTVLLAGCGANTSNSNPQTKGTTDDSAKKMKLIRSDQADFAQMVKTLSANPTAAEYKSQLLGIEMTIESVTNSGQDKFEATGTTGSVGVRSAFFLLPNSLVNSQITALRPGDKVDFWGQLTAFKPGPPRPELTIASGSISNVDMKAK